MEKITCKFKESSYKERLAFKNWRNLYNLFPESEWTVLITPYDGSDVYDVLVQNRSYKRIIIEIKVRGELATQKGIEEGFFYESKKHKSLTDLKDLDPDNNTIMYINFTTKGTYVWNINKIELKSIKREMNKATMNSNDKVNKSVYLLDVADAKFYSYVYDDLQYWNDTVNVDKAVRLSKTCRGGYVNMLLPWEV